MREELKFFKATSGESCTKVTGVVMRQGLYEDNWAISVKVRTMHVVLFMGLDESVLFIGPSGLFAYSDAAFGSGTGSLYYSSFNCIGVESALVSCPHAAVGC